MGAVSKKNTVRENVINLLGKEWPLTLKQIHAKLKKDYYQDVSYQAVFKAMNELMKDDAVLKEDKRYKINLRWVYHQYGNIRAILSNYLKDSSNMYGDFRISMFVEEIGPKIKSFFGDSPSCVTSIKGGGALFGLAVKKYLKSLGKEVIYIEVNRDNLKLARKDFEGKKVVVIDSSVYSGRTMRLIKEKFNEIREKYKIKEIKYAVGYDRIGLADWSCDELI